MKVENRSTKVMQKYHGKDTLLLFLK